jgi:phospholipid N-methyltransferase
MKSLHTDENIDSISHQNNSTSRSRAVLFARNFLKHPRMLGSIIPSSPFLMNRVLKRIDWANAKTFIEYGPGVGNFTAEILKRMRPDASLMVFETNGEFARFLGKSMSDPRLHVVHGSAAEVQPRLRRLGWNQADYVLSGIPFSTMPSGARDEILFATRSALLPNGAMLVYQFSRAVLPHLQSTFAKVERDFELLNVLPAHLFYCRD